jgi:hypothetical protein
MNIEVTEQEPVVETPVTDTVADTAAAAAMSVTAVDAVTDKHVVPPEEEQASAPNGTENRPLLVDIRVENEGVALNLLVGFLNVAQRRGTFNFRESAKIGECIEMFVKAGGPPSQ